MERWADVPVVEAFLIATLLIGLLAGLLLMVNRSPAGRWLGVLLLSLLMVIAVKAGGVVHYLPAVIVSVLIIAHQYLHAFFYQKRRVPFYHYVVLLPVGLVSYFLASYALILRIFCGAIGLAYLVLSTKLLSKESQTRGFSYFQNAGPRIAWLRNFVFILSGWLILSLLSLDVWISCALFWLLLSHVLYQLFQESAFLSPIPIGNKYKKSTLTPEIKVAVIDKLEEVMEANHFYRDDGASLSKLADLLGVTNHHLSQVLNDSLKISFQDLLARFRIREACKLLRAESNEQLKIETVANMVGYNSKSSFNTAFKKRTGLTPSDYRKAKNVRTYGEERLSERKAPYAAKDRRSLIQVSNLKMNQTMFKISLRNLRKNRLQSILNILGMAVAISACLMIAGYVHHEWSYDKHHPDAENIHRIVLNRIYPDYNKEWAITAPILTPTLQKEVPEVEHYTRISWDDMMLG
ncbi:MAG: helix-turn-helix domain-containing protein, partial [Bacteroidota bacterium]